MTMITKLLVANRGEIACRVMRTAAAMGIHTVAVFADPDAHEPFVSAADEAYALGGTSATDSYLDMERVLDAVRRSGADAVHPGYGFLAENAEFAQAVIDAGLTWVGPSPAAIAAMGDKLAAKRLMIDIGVPTLPSVELTADVDALAAALEIGYPVLVKAAAGGGGKGMRVVESAAELVEAIAAAQREAMSAFGDATVFLERYLTGSRHVEVQVLGDTHGTLLHLFERECSIQRRHQKIIEEAPSSVVDGQLRDRLGAAAVAAAQAIDYYSTGTVEFLLAADGTFAFLEVNTRLQVEHPVTEEITGIDLVRQQLLIAQGERLAFGQLDVSISGHAIEARLYAEDPANDFLPATGTLLAWGADEELDVRVDSGVAPGSVVGISFDPMLAKVISHAPTRDEAARRLALALERMKIQGIVTNRDFLVATLRHPEFLAGSTTTDFIEVAQPARSRTPSTSELHLAVIVAALTRQASNREVAPRLSTLRSGWRNSVMPPERVVFSGYGDELDVTYRSTRDNSFVGHVSGEAFVAQWHGGRGDLVEVSIGTRRLSVSVLRHDARWWVQMPGGDVVLDAHPRFPEPAAEEIAGGLAAQMPGKVLATFCEAGDHVATGQVLVVLEAMKMEHRIVAPCDGHVSQRLVTVGDQVGTGDLLVVIESAPVDVPARTG